MLPVVKLPKAILPIYLTTFVDMLGYTLLIPLLPSIAQRYGAHDWVVGMLLSVPAACAMVAAPIWGKTSDRAGRKLIILIAQGFTLAGYVILALAGSLFWIFISRLISGIGAGSIGTAQSYIADVTQENQRERAYALYGAVFGAAFIIGPIIAGQLQRYGLQFPFYIAAALEVSNIGLTSWLLPARTRSRRPQTSAKKSAKTAWRVPIRLVLIRQFLFIFAVVYLLADFALYLHHRLHEGFERELVACNNRSHWRHHARRHRDAALQTLGRSQRGADRFGAFVCGLWPDLFCRDAPVVFSGAGVVGDGRRNGRAHADDDLVSAHA